MFDKQALLKQKNVVRYAAAFCAGFALVVLLLIVMKPVPASAPSEPATAATTTEESSSLSSSLPEKLVIPAINLEADFEDPLYLLDNNEVEVPEAYTTVGYYGYGPTPGEVGPAVVLGHVDSYQGPAVFYDLGQLEIGDTVEIKREDGTTAVFAVTEMERHPQSDFPTEKVYGDIDYAGLRLITCTGTYNKGIQRYSHNLIVFAELISTSSTTEIIGE